MPQNRRTEGIPVSSLPLRIRPLDLDRLYIVGYNDQNVLVDYTIEYRDLINSVKNTYLDLKFTALVNSPIPKGNWILDAIFAPWEVSSVEFDAISNLLTISFVDKGDGTYPNLINKRLYIEQGDKKQTFIINRSHVSGYTISLVTDIFLINSVTLFHFTHITDALGSAVSDSYARPILWYRGTDTQPDPPDKQWGEYGLGHNLGNWVDDPSKLSGDGTVDWVAYGSFYTDNKSWYNLPWLVKRASDAAYVLYSKDGNRRESGHYPALDTDQYIKFVVSGSNWTPWIKFRGLPDEYTQIYSSKLNLASYDDTLIAQDILPFDLGMYSDYKFIFEWVSDGADPTTVTAISQAESAFDMISLSLGNNNSVTYGYGRTLSIYWSILHQGVANLCNFNTKQNSLAAADNVQLFKLNLNRAPGDTTSNIVSQFIFYDPGLVDEEGYIYILAK